MPTFHYIALDQNGQESAGVIERRIESEAIWAAPPAAALSHQVVRRAREILSAIKRAGPQRPEGGQGQGIRARHPARPR